MATARDGHIARGRGMPGQVGGFTTAFNSGTRSQTEYIPRVTPSDHVASPEPVYAPEPVAAPDLEYDDELSELERRYEWIVGLMSSFADERLVRWVIAFFTASMGVCATLEILYGFGATNPIAHGVQVGSAAFAFTVALWWMVTSWPRLSVAFGFVILSDIGIGIANISANMPPAYAVGKTAFFVVLGLFAGVFLDRWMLLTHIGLTSALVTGIIGYNVLFQDVPPLGALVVWAPVMSLVLAVPALLYTFVRAVRLDQS